ncbi:DUF572-domain-containing protein [Lophiostoma macrostomum CBS 122681]|uniref:Splicing factor YJU2 n=1 Tax=Lophiostoma macrostomum CBS 122681 TaxID=1314788 RepID=A0A6A6TD66_9PLEO|nr:DUF572-domain-containing protein [Lophiostoma macrostomum CBS 122681]
MSERKVLSKYYPPDFDPSLLGKRSRDYTQQRSRTITVRLASPFSMRCDACGEYIYKGRRFNARKETTDKEYLKNLRIYRFHIRCPRCSSEIIFCTDPKHIDYELEHGAKRNFEPWRESKLARETEEECLDRTEREAERPSIQQLEAKALDEKTNMEIGDALDEICSRNAQLEHAGMENTPGSFHAARDSTVEKQRQKDDDEDAELARRAFSRNMEDRKDIEEFTRRSVYVHTPPRSSSLSNVAR